MLRYFFDIHDGKHPMRDDEGWECPGLQEARVVAIRTLPDMARDVHVVPDRDRQDLVATVRDANDQMLLRITLSLRTEWLPASKEQATGAQCVSFAGQLGSVAPTE